MLFGIYSVRSISTIMILALWMLPALLRQGGSLLATANPHPEINRNDIMGQCLPGSDIRDVCERCAKTTKSELAYLLCCDDSVNVRNYCHQFLNFDLHGKRNAKKNRKIRQASTAPENIRNTLSNTWFNAVLNNGA